MRYLYPKLCSKSFLKSWIKSENLSNKKEMWKDKVLYKWQPSILFIFMRKRKKPGALKIVKRPNQHVCVCGQIVACLGQQQLSVDQLQLMDSFRVRVPTNESRVVIDALAMSNFDY